MQNISLTVCVILSETENCLCIVNGMVNTLTVQLYLKIKRKLDKKL